MTSTELALRILSITFPIFAIVVVGFIYGWYKKPDLTITNKINMDVFIPALMFSVLVERGNDAQIFSHLGLGTALIILLTGMICFVIAKLIHISPRTLCPTIMFGNAGNLGLPLILLSFGDQALATAVVIFVVTNFLHVSIGSYLMGKQTDLVEIIKTPMLLAVLFALVVNYSPITIPALILKPISMMGQICVPLMLFALGVRLLDTPLKEWRIGLLAAFLSPVCGITIAFIIIQFLDLTPIQQGSLFLFGALPPAVLNFMFAEHFKQEPGRVAAMVLYGNAVSIITIPLALAYAIPKFT